MIIVRVLENGPSTATGMDELIVSLAWLQLLADQVEKNGYEVPQSLKNRLDECDLELSLRMRATRQKELRALEIQHESLMTANEKRKAIEQKMAALKEKLK